MSRALPVFSHALADLLTAAIYGGTVALTGQWTASTTLGNVDMLLEEWRELQRLQRGGAALPGT